jgi:branched-chain amino acid transport system ATP-binding protein
MGKEGSWEVKKCLWHGVPFLVLSALRHIQEKMEVRKVSWNDACGQDALDNLEIGGFNLLRKQLKERIEIILQTFPALKSRLKESAGNLSGGEQQMLALSRALIPPTKLLLLDEPSLGLAPNLLGNVFKKLVEINKEFGLAMLIVEQKVLEVLEICHRVYSIKLGRVAFEGKPEELKGNKQKIKELFL